jgi:3-deoxy-7-phosphoheptulonate synthase
VGADGLLVEVHPCPEQAMSDGNQSLTFAEFRSMMTDLQPYIELQQESRVLRPQLLAVGGAD